MRRMAHGRVEGDRRAPGTAKETRAAERSEAAHWLRSLLKLFHFPGIFHTFDVVGTLFVVENEYEKNF